MYMGNEWMCLHRFSSYSSYSLSSSHLPISTHHCGLDRLLHALGHLLAHGLGHLDLDGCLAWFLLVLRLPLPLSFRRRLAFAVPLVRQLPAGALVPPQRIHLPFLLERAQHLVVHRAGVEGGLFAGRQHLPHLGWSG